MASLTQIDPIERDGSSFKVKYNDGVEIVIDRKFDGQERPPCTCGCIDALIIKPWEAEAGLWICLECGKKRNPRS